MGPVEHFQPLPDCVAAADANTANTTDEHHNPDTTRFS
jgi:hypothetical protein